MFKVHLNSNCDPCWISLQCYIQYRRALLTHTHFACSDCSLDDTISIYSETGPSLVHTLLDLLFHISRPTGANSMAPSQRTLLGEATLLLATLLPHRPGGVASFFAHKRARNQLVSFVERVRQCPVSWELTTPQTTALADLLQAVLVTRQ